MGIRNSENFETEIKFSDVYAVEFANYGLVHSPKSGLVHAKECFRERLLNTQEVFFSSLLSHFLYRFFVFLLVGYSVTGLLYCIDASVHCARIAKITKGTLSLETCRIHFWPHGLADVPELDGSFELFFDQGSRKTKKSPGKSYHVRF